DPNDPRRSLTAARTRSTGLPRAAPPRATVRQMSTEIKRDAMAAGAGIVLLTLCAGQFLMALDSSGMNVSIATVADDLGTSITGIQSAIVLYTLVMAMLMVTGGKVGSMIGRKRAFLIGLFIYCSGSLTTALAPNLPVLLFGWSILEGIGAALIMPAIVALGAGNFPAQGRPRAYGLRGAAGGKASAVGPPTVGAPPPDAAAT